MDKSTSNLIGNVFEKRIRKAGEINKEFKSTQLTSGASGVLAYQAENPDAWDRTEVLPYVDPSSGGFGDIELTITFTGDGSQQLPFAYPATDIRFNGTGEANKPTFRDGMWSWNQVQVIYYDRLDESTLEDPYVIKWKVRFYYIGALTYYVKLGARGTCPGTISVARTA